MRRFALVALFIGAFACAGSAVPSWRERPPFAKSASWHCVETGKGSFCEPSRERCERAKSFVRKRGNLVLSGATNCMPSKAIYCFTYLRNPTIAPASNALESVHDVATDDWTYDCSQFRATCERAQQSLLRDRAEREEPTSDVAPCAVP